MKRFSVKRLLVVLGVVSATAAVVASSALAGPTPTTTCTSAKEGQEIVGNLVVPAGETCSLSYVKITGNVSVQGTLFATAVTAERNVNVNGGGLYQYNYPTIIKGNLAITGSAGDAYYGVNAFNTAYGPSEVWGNFSYTGNSAPLYIGGSGLKVTGNFNHSGNTSTPNISDDVLKVDGNKTIA